MQKTTTYLDNKTFEGLKTTFHNNKKILTFVRLHKSITMDNAVVSFSLRLSPMPCAIVQSNGSLIEFSNAACRFFELEKDAKTLEDFTGKLSKAFKRALKNNECFTETIKIISRNGRVRWVKTNAYPIPNQEDSFQICFDDVTEGKIQFELALKAKRIAKVGSWSADLVNNTLNWSNVTKEIHEVPEDFSPDLEQGINFYKEGESRDAIIDAVSECIESGKPFDLELVIVTQKGNEKWVRAIGQAERTNGKTLAFSGVFQDIDKLKRERMAYETNNERLRAGITSANVGVWDFDIINNELFWDDKMYDLYGVDKKDFNGVYDAWERTIHPEDKERAAAEVVMAIEKKKQLNTEFKVVKKDGSIAFIHAEAKVFCDDIGRPVRLVGANTDVTRMKRKDERLRRLLNVTEKQNQRLLQFTNIVSHNLRSNSSNISMLAGMLNEELPVGTQQEFIDMIQTSSEQLDETIAQLNEIVKIQATDEREIKEIVLNTCVQNVLQSVNGLLLEADAKVNINYDPDLKVRAIKPYLTSVVLNLMTNSIKYRKPNGSLEITISARKFENQTIISFEDNGLGIDLKKYRANIFGMYKTFHNHSDSKGIGLFITKTHMQAMNGKIEVESAVNKGCTFHLYFANTIN